MKKKTAPKRSSKAQRKSSPGYDFYIKYTVIGSLVVILLLIGRTTYQALQSSNVLGTNTYLAENSEKSINTEKRSSIEDKSSENNDQEKPDSIEPTDSPEPTDVSEQENEAEKVSQEVEKQVKDNNVENIEVQPPAEGSESGKVILQQNQGSTQELKTPISMTTSVTQITSSQAGTLSIHVSNVNAITINNGPYTITTQFPIIINPKDQTMAIKTPSGVTLIKTFPSEAFQNLPPESKLSSISSINLNEQQGAPVYETNGIQIRKFLGLIPVEAKVKENIDAQTGQVIKSDSPWYFSTFVFQTI